MEMALSRNSSEKNTLNQEELEFLTIFNYIKRDHNSSHVACAKLKIKIRPLCQTNGLQIYLIRENDPAFYYSVDITADDYRELRQQQGLLVDLESFPAMIYRLLNNCISEENSENPKNFPVLEFNNIRGDEVTFKIQKIIEFRSLAHLSLCLRKGNDAKVREHLGECLQHLKLDILMP